MRSFPILIVGLLCTIPASAAIINVDGLFDDANLYNQSWTLQDDDGESGIYQPGLDINKVLFQRDSSFFYIALEVAQGPIIRSGGLNSRPKCTEFTCYFDDVTDVNNPIQLYELIIVMKDSCIDAYLHGSKLVQDVHYFAAADDGLEVAVTTSLLSNMSSISQWGFFAQLDDTGAYADDQIAGIIPEPLALGLLVMGCPLLMRRKRN